MSYLQAIFLGIVQGLTEFLPVSSSGHLVFLHHIFGAEKPQVLFDVMVHGGTLAAVLIFFRRDIRLLVRGLIRFTIMKTDRDEAQKKTIENPALAARLVFLILLATIPAGLAGFFLRDIFESLFGSVPFVSSALLVTGVLLILTAFVRRGGKDLAEISVLDALLIGLMQAAAICPGISRSGATISMGLYLGLDRESSARFSFLVCIPAVVGAILLKLKDVHPTEMGGMALGTLVAFVTGLLALKLLLTTVKRGRISYFAFYCWLLGIVGLIRSI